MLKDGRLASGSNDKSIIIYNSTTFQRDLIIKEHNSCVDTLIQLKSGILVSGSCDKTIKLFNIQGVNYQTLQTLTDHQDVVSKLLELKNKNFISCSHDATMIIFKEKNAKNQYTQDCKISTDGACYSVIQIKDNEICYSEGNNNKISFYDLNGRRIISSIPNISKYNGERGCCLIMITKDLLLVPGDNQISIINVNEYRLVRIIEVPGSNFIIGSCMLNDNMILTGDGSKTQRQFKIEGDNLILISKKENAHNDQIYSLVKIGNGLIASSSGSNDRTIKIW